jgi:hypothetical protein
MIRLICKLYSVAMVLGIAIFFAVLDPDFDEDEGSIKDMCDFARDAFQTKQGEMMLKISMLLIWASVGYFLTRSIVRVVCGTEEEEVS